MERYLFLVKGRYGRIFISGKGKIWKDIYSLFYVVVSVGVV